MLSVSIIGVGKLGGALALALDKRGFRIDNLIGKTNDNARKILSLFNSKPRVSSVIEPLDSDIIFISTQDSEIETVASQIPDSTRSGQFVFHTSGSLSSQILANLIESGYEIGSIHPLVSISDSEIGTNRFADAFFCIEGSKPSLDIARQVVEALSGKPFTIDSKHKALYHASAVTACGHVVALFSIAQEMLLKCDLDGIQASEILFPLLKSTVDNLSFQSPESALTGTFARIDQEVFQNHIKSISDNLSPDILDLYLALGLQSLRLNTDTSPERLLKIEKMKQSILIAKNSC